MNSNGAISLRPCQLSRFLHATLVLTVCCAILGCGSNMSRIDRRVSKLLAESAAPLGEDATAPDAAALHVGDSQPGSKDERIAERPPTVNPNAADLQFETINEAVEVIER